MIGLLALLLAMLVPVGGGTGLLWLALPRLLRDDPLGRIFLGGFLGLVLVTVQIFIYSLARIPRSFWSLLLPWVGALLILGGVRAWVGRAAMARLKRSGRKVRRPDRHDRREQGPRISGREWVVIGLLLSLLLVELFWIATMTVNEPVWGWDTMVNWSRKAKVYYYEVRPDCRRLPLAPYPLCVPLAQTWVFHCLGDWNDAIGKGIFILPFVLGGLGFYTVLRSLTHRTWALAATVALLATPRIFFNLTEGYADAFLALLYGPGVLLLCRWLVRGDPWDVVAGALCLGMTAWIKAEGLPFGLMAFVAAVAIRLIRQRRWSRELSLVVPVALVLVVLAGVAWQVVVRQLDLGEVHGQGVYSLANFRQQLTGERLGTITSRLWAEVRLFQQWGLIWFVWPVAALLHVRRLVRPDALLLLLAVCADALLIYVVFITTAFEISWHLNAALERLMISMLPLLFALTTIQAYGLFGGEPPVSAQTGAQRAG